MHWYKTYFSRYALMYTNEYKSVKRKYQIQPIRGEGAPLFPPGYATAVAT